MVPPIEPLPTLAYEQAPNATLSWWWRSRNLRNLAYLLISICLFNAGLMLASFYFPISVGHRRTGERLRLIVKWLAIAGGCGTFLWFRRSRLRASRAAVRFPVRETPATDTIPARHDA